MNLDLFLFGASAILFNAVRGAAESITMHRAGARGHPWFWLYHRIRLLESCFFALVIAAAYRLQFSPGVGLAVFVIGIALASWEAFELVYALGTRNLPRWVSENVMGTGYYVTGESAIIILHVARIALAAAFIFTGKGMLP